MMDNIVSSIKKLTEAGMDYCPSHRFREGGRTGT